MSIVDQPQDGATQCGSCRPGSGRALRVALRSDNFCVLAGFDDAVPQALAIAHHRCGEESSYHAMADVPQALLDEVRFLRGIVSHYFRERHGEDEFSVEYGHLADSVGGLSPSSTYGAVLRCYPGRLATDGLVFSGPAEPLTGLHELGGHAGSRPYVYIEHKTVNDAAQPGRVERERWESVVAPAGHRGPGRGGLPQPSADRLGTADHPPRRARLLDTVGRSAMDFTAWVLATDRYAALLRDGVAVIDFYLSVRTSNTVGNDAVAADYRQTWATDVQREAVVRFERLLPPGPDGRMWVLDAACGPGMYLNAMHRMRLRGVGADISPCMLQEARTVIGDASDDGPAASLVRADAAALPFREGAFSGIWYSAGLVHMPRGVAPAILRGYYRLLREHGVLYVSYQLGRGVVVRREGRIFFYYDENEVQAIADNCGFSLVEQWDGESNRSSLGGTRQKFWRHLLLRRRHRS